MGIEKSRKANIRFGILWIVAAAIMLLVQIHAANENYGLEGDEVFSYISATSMGGFKQICFLDDQTWYDGSYFADALTASGGGALQCPHGCRESGHGYAPAAVLYFPEFRLLCL